ncbi:MAG: DUF6687 family protein [Planctomycetota bacterium]
MDGAAEGCRSLSHWPGNSTPEVLRHDLSTGIALAFARLSPAEQLALVGPFDTVCNNHYDTDGALAAFALLRPEEALPRSEALLAAAATGDFGWWRGPQALAVDLTITELARHSASPLATESELTVGGLLSLPDDERYARAYAWLLEHLPAVIDEPYAFNSLWEPDFQRILADVERIEAGTGISVRAFPEDEFALVSSDRAMTSIGLHLAAGEAHRVLLVRPSARGFRYLFRYRVESWFVLASRQPARRVPLGAAVAALNAAERKAGGAGPRAGAIPAAPATAAEPRWWCQSLEAPVVELGYGDPAARAGGIFEDPEIEAAPPSRLLPSQVIEILRAEWARSVRS